MAEVYMLWHLYWYMDDEGYEEEEGKILGLYTSEEEAMEAAKRYYKLPGFNKYPFDCFGVDKYKVDEDSAWVGGFFSPHERIYHIVKKNVDVWDPLNLFPYAPDNEYDIESKQIAKQVKLNHTVEELAEIISQVFSEGFGREYDAKCCSGAAEAIYKDLNEEFKQS